MNPQVVTIAGEGRLDLEVAAQLVLYYGGEVGNRYDSGGKSGIHSKIKGYNNSAQKVNVPWLVLLDLNSEECPISLRDKLLSEIAPLMCFRIAIKEIEAWLMGDKENLEIYLGISRGSLPTEPEKIENPKEELLRFARRSKKREIREGMVRKNSSNLDPGPRYTTLLRRYVQNHWRPEVAAERVDSLRRAMACVERLLKL